MFLLLVASVLTKMSTFQRTPMKNVFINTAVQLFHNVEHETALKLSQETHQFT